jgi:two-component system response regulator PilR (NtrC family)
VNSSKLRQSRSRDRILIVDDDAIIGSLWERVLAEEGYGVRRVISARSSLMELQIREFQAVIMDLALPDMDGLDLIRRIRMDFHWIRIIVISGAVGDHMVPLIRSAGADAAQAKPIDLNRMRALVYRTLESIAQCPSGVSVAKEASSATIEDIPPY